MLETSYMYLLSVVIKKALLDGYSEKLDTYATLKVQNVKSSTQHIKGCEPIWEESFLFEINQIDIGLLIEVWNKGILWDSLIGCFYTSLQSVQPSTEPGEGAWYALYSNTVTRNGTVCGTQNLTSHKLLCDIHFEIPNSLTDEEIAIVQRHLDEWNAEHDETWLVERLDHSVSYPSTNLSIDSDYASQQQGTTVNTSDSTHKTTFRKDSLLSNTDNDCDSYNCDIGSETESRLSRVGSHLSLTSAKSNNIGPKESIPTKHFITERISSSSSHTLTFIRSVEL